MNAMAELLTTPKPRRRWLQFSLRTLLVLMLLLGCGLGWFAREVHKARAQGEAKKAIEKLGGRVGWDRPPGGMMRTAVVLAGKLLGEDLYWDVSQVFLSDTPVTDAGLVHLCGLTQLGTLSLNNTRVTDAGLVHLRGLTQFNGLGLNDTTVTDAGLMHLRRLTQLRWLGLRSTQATDAGLAQLQELTQLCALDLNNTHVTDAGLVRLCGLTQLQVLARIAHRDGSKKPPAGYKCL